MNRPIPSLQVIASPRMGGAETTFLRLAGALKAAGHPVTAGLRRGAALEPLLRAQDIPVRTASLRNYLDLPAVMQLRQHIEQTQVPVVQSWASRAAWLTRPRSGTLHVSRLGGYYKLRYFRHADAWVVNTRGLRDWMVTKGFPADRVEWINNFVPESGRSLPLPLSREQLGIPLHALVVISLGRFIDKKGFQDLVPAFARLPAEVGGRPVHLVLVGDGPMLADLRSAAAPMAARVHFTGWVDHPVSMLGLGDLFVCPSRVEPMGNVVLEAWSQGLPVICTETVGGFELIQNGDTGLLCPVADVPRLAAVMEKALRDDALRQGLATHGRVHYQHRYSEQKTVDAYLEFYRRLLRDGYAGRARQEAW